MESILAGMTAFNTLSPMVLALIAELRSKDPRTDDEIIAAARSKVAQIRQITEEDMGNQP
jgi:hypothetical protein